MQQPQPQPQHLNRNSRELLHCLSIFSGLVAVAYNKYGTNESIKGAGLIIVSMLFIRSIASPPTEARREAYKPFRNVWHNLFGKNKPQGRQPAEEPSTPLKKTN